MTTRAKMHVTFMKHTIGKVSERKSDHYGTTSRHDKKDRQKETETSKEEETEKTEEIRLLPIAQISYFSFLVYISEFYNNKIRLLLKNCLFFSCRQRETSLRQYTRGCDRLLDQEDSVRSVVFQVGFL
jgi:hypothetical protein